jgi:hypothetical protein
MTEVSLRMSCRVSMWNSGRGRAAYLNKLYLLLLEGC